MTAAECHELDWLNELERCAPAAAGPVRARLPDVRRRVLARTILALTREGFLHQAGDGPDAIRFDLPGSGESLQAPGFSASFMMLSADAERFLLAQPGRPQQSIDHPVQVLDWVHGHVGGDADAWRRLALEITDSVLNEAWADVAHERSNEAVAAAAGGPGDWLGARLRCLDPGAEPTVLLDQWAAVGHPLHVVPKSRLDLPPSAAQASCPEFHPRVAVRLAAVRRDRAGVELPAESGSVDQYLGRHHPEWYAAWRAALADTGRNRADYLPLPFHPWQAHRLEAVLGALLADDDLALLDGPERAMHPTLSVRSLVPADDVLAPGLKVSLAVRLTSALRTITPRSCHMGVRISRLLREILADDAALEADLLDEELGLYFAAEDPRLAGQLAAIFRSRVATRVDAGERAIPAAALPLTSPLTGRPLLLELAAAAGHEPRPLDILAAYAAAVITPVLRLFLVHGIGLEAHGQNTLAVYGADGVFRRPLFRDLAGIRIHEPTLHAHGRSLELHPDRRTVVDHFADHRFWLMHRLFGLQLGHLALALARHCGVPERRSWGLLGEITAAAFDSVRDDAEPDLWRSERAAFLDRDWQAKSSLRMRLADQVRDIPAIIPNPFR